MKQITNFAQLLYNTTKPQFMYLIKILKIKLVVSSLQISHKSSENREGVK